MQTISSYCSDYRNKPTEASMFKISILVRNSCILKYCLLGVSTLVLSCENKMTPQCDTALACIRVLRAQYPHQLCIVVSLGKMLYGISSD